MGPTCDAEEAVFASHLEQKLVRIERSYAVVHAQSHLQPSPSCYFLSLLPFCVRFPFPILSHRGIRWAPSLFHGHTHVQFNINYVN